ncbi:GNAT family N-acetyltransferase [bacterium]|nr:GNAT family N-acetyltransferase [bacterium]
MAIVESFLDLEPMCDGELELRVLSRTPADPEHGRAASYGFGMFLPGRNARVGIIDLRLGESEDLKRYGGQVGYLVESRFRGRGLAARAVGLLLPLARRHGFRELWITCDPENLASRRSCERAGAVFQELVQIPPGHEMFERGLRVKCRYRLSL